MVITVYGKSRNGNLKYSCNLNEITDGSRFFYNSQIEKFPEGVIFEKLKQGTYMFSYSKLKEVPKGATFNSLTNAKRIFE